MSRRLRLLLPLVLALALVPVSALSSAGVDPDGYHNHLEPSVPGDGVVENCADPTVLRGQQDGDPFWYMYCTTDPLNDQETAGPGRVVFHPIPMMRSSDLVTWTYVGDALPEPPSWAADTSRLWAPDVVYSRTHDRYYLTFVVTNLDGSVSGEPACDKDTAIGVATSRNPTGPWRTSDTPVVPPRRNPGQRTGCHFLNTLDPDVLGNRIATNGILYYGGFGGGVFGQRVTLSRRRMKTSGPSTRVTVGSRYEGANVVRRDNWYYLFVSATNCCNGPLTGYSVFVGRSRKPLGPYVDRDGNSLLAGRVGGTPVLSMNGNRWVGTGHTSVFPGFDGQWWTIYHAIDRGDPYFEGRPGFTKRPAMLDPLDWKQGWPAVRAGHWASDEQMPAPAAQPGETSTYRPTPIADDRRGRRLDSFSDEFSGSRLSNRWSWVRKPKPARYDVDNGRLRVDTDGGDLSGTGNSNNAPVLVQAAPNRRNYVMETKVRLDVPPEGCCPNFVQAGLLSYGNDDDFVKLVHVSIWRTWQTEFVKEVDAKYGSTVVGTPSAWTYLRVVKRSVDSSGPEDAAYTAYTSQDGSRWVRGGTWTHQLGDDDKIGLVSMGRTGFTATFDYVRVWSAPR